MKKIYLHIIIAALLTIVALPSSSQDVQDLVQQCAVNAGDDATYLKDFIVKLDAAEPEQRPPVYRQSLALRKNVMYRFSLCNMDNSEGEAVLRVYDQAKLILSTYYPATGKEYSAINFACKKSGIYTVVISFKEGKAGEAIGILSYVKN
jgi:hypothetical protein